MAFVKSVCAAMERVAPLRLAESWDNVGLLLEAPVPRAEKKILLTIDLTPPVLQEALDCSASVIVTYHPSIFRPLSSLTLKNPLQSSLLRCAQAGISVYSPHTALDSVKNGINDWLASGIHDPVDGEMKVAYIQDKGDLEGGMGRLLTLPEPGLTLQSLVQRVKQHLNIRHLEVALPHGKHSEQKKLRSVAICAGSGGPMLMDVDADVYFTGEMAHHEVLAAIGSNRVVVLCGHTNTERGYLRTLAEKLRKTLVEQDNTLSSVEIEISKEDKHPLELA